MVVLSVRDEHMCRPLGGLLGSPVNAGLPVRNGSIITFALPNSMRKAECPNQVSCIVCLLACLCFQSSLR